MCNNKKTQGYNNRHVVVVEVTYDCVVGAVKDGFENGL